MPQSKDGLSTKADYPARAWRRGSYEIVERRGDGSFPVALRVHRVQGAPGVWEITFAPDGRATFEYGEEIIAGEPHIIWRRIGHHDVLSEP
ncbi:MAG: hypothetical protein ACHQC8_00035 [Solirubrobacterales bacterium]